MAKSIALIGSGIFAKEEHLPAIRANSSTVVLAAIYSRSLKSAKDLAASSSEGNDDVELYSDDQEGRGYEDLLKREDIKGVVIALPILVQPSFIKRALAAGKHVLAEKPIAKDVATASELLDWTRSNIDTKTGPTFSIAENFRFLPSFQYAADEIKNLGRLLGFRMRMQALVQPGAKYYETAWRKKPEYQGGFLLDGGVHFIAATRLILAGAGVQGVKTSAFTAQLQDHLPPVDTVNATVQLSNGTSGTISMSFGTTFSGSSEYAFACEKGTVVVTRGKVVVTKEGKDEAKEFPDEGSGVGPEIAAWGKGLAEGKMDQKQSAEEALKDLELLEAMLTSGEKGGAPVELKL